MTPPRHRVLIRYGYLRPRIELCSYPGCQVAEEWVSGCGELACALCGVGPVEMVTDQLLWCSTCGAYVHMLNLGQEEERSE